MSFLYAPSQLRIPQVPGWSPPDGVWCGIGEDAGRFAFRMSAWGGYVMTDGGFCWSLEADGIEMRPVYSSVNGYIYWEAEGYGCVYYTQSYGWVWCDVFPGYEPLEEVTQDPATGEAKFDGDGFYHIASIPCRDGGEAAMSPCGKLFGKPEKTVRAVWRRWASQYEFGKYGPKGGASGDRYLGLPRWRGNGTYYVRSPAKEDGHYAYGQIRFSDGKWTVGEVGSDSGWWEGAEPSKEGPVTFRFVANEGSEAEGADFDVAFLDCVRGDGTADVMLGEAAVWR